MFVLCCMWVGGVWVLLGGVSRTMWDWTMLTCLSRISCVLSVLRVFLGGLLSLVGFLFVRPCRTRWGCPPCALCCGRRGGWWVL